MQCVSTNSVFLPSACTYSILFIWQAERSHPLGNSSNACNGWGHLGLLRGRQEPRSLTCCCPGWAPAGSWSWKPSRDSGTVIRDASPAARVPAPARVSRRAFRPELNVPCPVLFMSAAAGFSPNAKACCPFLLLCFSLSTAVGSAGLLSRPGNVFLSWRLSQFCVYGGAILRVKLNCETFWHLRNSIRLFQCFRVDECAVV